VAKKKAAKNKINPRRKNRGKMKALYGRGPARAPKTSSSTRGSHRLRRYVNPARMPKNWIKADKVRVVTNGGRKVLEVWRKKPKPKPKKKAARRR
jgi:hypothetical protein